ncbi:MAG: CRTAC1 family protein [Acidobacteriota bacterium]
MSEPSVRNAAWLLAILYVARLSSPASAAPAATDAGQKPLYFREMLAGSGITYRNVSGEMAKRTLLSSLGAGACLLDYDDDGDGDLYLVNGASLDEGTVHEVTSNQLYRNQGSWKFQEVGPAAGVADRHWGTGCSVGDVDNDGFDDLYVTNVGANALYRNLGDGRFEDITSIAAVGDPLWGSSSAFFDADRDGNLDLYVANYVGGDLMKLPFGCKWFQLTVFCGPYGLEAAPDVFYRNLGDGRFTEASGETGFQLLEPGYGLGVVVGDYDDDGDSDLYVANDSAANFLFQNDGHGKFSEVALLAGAAFSGEGLAQAGMGVDMGDLNGDGRLDLFITNFSHDNYTPYLNVGDGLFTDQTASAGLSKITYFYLGWATRFADFDNDGDQDLFAANGHIYPGVDGSDLKTSYRQRNQVYWNQGDGSLEEVKLAAEDGLSEIESSRGAAFGDVDNDGDTDVVVVNIDGPPSLLRNEVGDQKHWVEFLLVGRTSNRNAIGARLTLDAGSRLQVQEVRPSGSYLSSSDRRVHFGLGSSAHIHRLRIRWPDGDEQELTDLAADRLYRIVQESRAALTTTPSATEQKGIAEQ